MKVTPLNRKIGRYNPGDPFDLPDKTAKALIKIGKVAEYQQAAIQPEEVSPRTGLPKRQYNRRDLKATE